VPLPPKGFAQAFDLLLQHAAAAVCSTKKQRASTTYAVPALCFLLLTQTQSCDQSTVTLDVLLLEVGQQIAAAANHLHQTTAAVVIVRVLLQVLIQLVDVSGQQSDLNFGGASVLPACS